MNSQIISLSFDSNIKEIAERMKTDRIDSIVIFKHQEPVGIVTDWDIVTDRFFTRCTPKFNYLVRDYIKTIYH